MIRNYELIILINCKMIDIAMGQLVNNFFPASNLPWLRGHPTFNHNAMRMQSFTVPIVDEKVKYKGEIVNKSQKSKALGEKLVSLL